jgi:hypothetical protein
MLIGDDDPVVPLKDRASFTQEMKEAGAGNFTYSVG